MDLTGKNAIVTGASRNIGQQIAIDLAKHGADVGITARENLGGCEETASLVRESGSNAATITGNLANPSDIEEIVEHLRTELGPIDILVNNATVRPQKKFTEVSVEELQEVLQINFQGQYLMAQHVVPDMMEKNEGSIVNLLGTMVYLGSPQHVHSYGSKLGIEGLVRQLATELGEYGIRVNGLSPGVIKVDRDRGENWDSVKEGIIDSTPLCRLGTPEDIADACTFLSSNKSSFITGQVLHVNGGLYPIPNILG